MFWGLFPQVSEASSKAKWGAAYENGKTATKDTSREDPSQVTKRGRSVNPVTQIGDRAPHVTL